MLGNGNHTCDQQQPAHSNSWDPSNEDWDAHKVGLVVCGVCAGITILFSMFNFISHALNYRVPGQQRHILRILYLPMIYGTLSFLSYRFFGSYLYFTLGEAVYEAYALGAFLLLLVEYVAVTGADIDVKFLYLVKFSVLQYVVIKPLIAILTVITQAAGVLCNGTWNLHFASPYLRVIDTFLMGYAVWGLLQFYKRIKDQLRGRRALAKFVCIKIVIFLGVIQTLLLSILDKRGVIHGTKTWAESDVMNGINAICTCLEMVFVAALMLWAYSPSEYKKASAGEKRGIARAYWDCLNISDVLLEIVDTFSFLFLSGSSNDQRMRTKAVPGANRAYDMSPYGVKEGGEPLAAAPYASEGRYDNEYQPPAFAPEREGRYHQQGQ